MKWYNSVLITLCIGASCFLWGLKTCSKYDEQKFEKSEKVFWDKQNVKQEIDRLRQITEPNTAEPIVQWKIVKMNVSAYCPCAKCCSKEFADGITASGYHIKKGDKFVAAPRKYEYGQEMIVPGYNNGKIVEMKDIGGAIKGNCLDLYFDTHKEALVWGRQHIDVLVKEIL